ncbi:hypothetical protein FOCC_FOCC015789 [Frankliniella occidentalis]|nr:hypothetical protein FOCC_FOCC015789 [Frankliniella occidentalis]
MSATEKSSSESSSPESSGDESSDGITLPEPPPKKRKQWLLGQPLPTHMLNCLIAQGQDEASCSDESSDRSLLSELHRSNSTQPEELNIESNFQTSYNDTAVAFSADGPDSTSLENTASESSSAPSISADSSSDSEHSKSSTSENGTPEEIDITVKLFPGSKVTMGQAVSKLLDICCRHAAPKALISDLVKYIGEILPGYNTFPRSMYYFEKVINPYIPPNLAVVHYCCEGCGTYLENGTNSAECSVCDQSNVKSFYEFPLETQIKYLFEQRNLADVMDSYQEKVRDLTDITKGEEYLRVKCNLSAKYDVVLLCSADGLRPHNNSEQEIWTLTYTICEIPPQLRKVFTMVSQIWYGKKKPPMNAFLIPFSEAVTKLYSKGVTWTHPRTKEDNLTRGTGPVFTLDAPARAIVQNIVQFSGFFSCNICEIEGEHVKSGRGGKVVFPNEDDVVLRTKEAMEDQTESVLNNGVVVKGVAGDSTLNLIPLCNRSTAILYEYMHLILLGVTRQFFCKWFASKKRIGKNKKKENEPWYIGDKTKAINKFLQIVKGTYELSRFPKDLDKYKTFKATTWLVWLLYVSPIALQKYLPQDYFQHWILLVLAVHTLLNEVISENEREVAAMLLSVFVEKAEKLYGKEIMTYNVHGLTHMALMVKRWGALWSHSTFLFEDFNGVITRNLHGTVNISEEFTNVLSRHIANATLKNYLTVAQDESSTNPALKGKEFYYTLSQRELVLLRQYSPNTEQRIPIHGRVQRGNTIFTTISYNAEHTTNNKTIVFKSDENTKVFGTLQFFYNNGGQILAFIKALDVDNDSRFKHLDTGFCVRHIVPILETEDICVVPLENILSKVIRLGNYVCVPPNKFERNL